MISVSISAAAATRNLGFWTNFGIMAREAPPRPITPTPKTRSLAPIYPSENLPFPSFRKGVRTRRANSPFGKGGQMGDLSSEFSCCHSSEFLNELLTNHTRVFDDY